MNFLRGKKEKKSENVVSPSSVDSNTPKGKALILLHELVKTTTSPNMFVMNELASLVEMQAQNPGVKLQESLQQAKTLFGELLKGIKSPDVNLIDDFINLMVNPPKIPIQPAPVTQEQNPANSNNSVEHSSVAQQNPNQNQSQNPQSQGQNQSEPESVNQTSESVSNAPQGNAEVGTGNAQSQTLSSSDSSPVNTSAPSSLTPSEITQANGGTSNQEQTSSVISSTNASEPTASTSSPSPADTSSSNVNGEQNQNSESSSSSPSSSPLSSSQPVVKSNSDKQAKQKSAEDEAMMGLVMDELKELMEVTTNSTKETKDKQNKSQIIIDKLQKDQQSIRSDLDEIKDKFGRMEKSIEKFIGLYEVVTNMYNPFVEQGGSKGGGSELDAELSDQAASSAMAQKALQVLDDPAPSLQSSPDIKEEPMVSSSSDSKNKNESTDSGSSDTKEENFFDKELIKQKGDNKEVAKKE